MKPVPNLNHEINAKKKEKLLQNSPLEDTVRQWVETVLEIRLDPQSSFATLFKNGVLLCELLNKLKPGLISVKKIEQSNSPFKQMGNIQLFLDGCKQLGMKPGDLFNTIDLFEEKDIMNVITTVFVLGSYAATIQGYSGPHLAKPSSRTGSLRRQWQPVKEPLKARDSAEELQQPSVAPLNTDMVTKQQFKYDPQRERTARQWIEAVVGHSFPYPTFAHSLKDGMVLCQVLNAIQPGTVPKINSDILPFKQRENIESYLKGCVKLGLPASGLFDTNSLFEEQDINSVIDNIHALAKHAQKIGYIGPQIKATVQSTPSLYRFEYMLSYKDNTTGSADEQPPTDEETIALLAWANNYLKNRDLLATNASRDFTNGVRLCVLVESVTGTGVGLYVKDPILPWHAMQNIGLALQALTSTAALYEKLVNVTGHAILCGDKTAIMELLRVIYELDTKSISSVPYADRRQKVAEEIVSSERSYVALLGTISLKKIPYTAPNKLTYRSTRITRFS